MKIFFCSLILLSLNSFSFAEISCPSQISVTDSPRAPKGWKGKKGERKLDLIGINVIHKVKGAEYDLAPDSEENKNRQVREEWDLTHYHDGSLFLFCKYRNTDATVSTLIPASLKTCSMNYAGDEHSLPIDIPKVNCR